MTKLSFSNTDEILDSIFALLLLTIVGVFPIFTLAFLYYHRKKLRDENFKVRFDSLYDHVVVEKDYALLLSTFFVGRRLLYAVTLNYLSRYVYLQILLSSLGSLSVLSFYVKVKPMETKLLNFLEIMNEMTVFILFSFNYLFTEYVALQE